MFLFFPSGPFRFSAELTSSWEKSCIGEKSAFPRRLNIKSIPKPQLRFFHRRKSTHKARGFFTQSNFDSAVKTWNSSRICFSLQDKNKFTSFVSKYRLQSSKCERLTKCTWHSSSHQPAYFSTSIIWRYREYRYFHNNQ